MLEVILTKGLPASGKTTWTKQTMADNPGKYVNVNKDDLRMMLCNSSKFDDSVEKMLGSIRDHIILTALEKGKSVIVSDLNIATRHEAHIRLLIRDKATVKVKTFDTSIEECILRDSIRENPVGESEIRRLAKVIEFNELYEFLQKTVDKDIKKQDIIDDIELEIFSGFGGSTLGYVKISEVKQLIDEEERSINRDYFIKKIKE